MTKKDFKIFADVVVRLRKKEKKEKRIFASDVENLLVGILQNDNDRFDPFKWDDYIDKGLKQND